MSIFDADSNIESTSLDAYLMNNGFIPIITDNYFGRYSITQYMGELGISPTHCHSHLSIGIPWGSEELKLIRNRYPQYIKYVKQLTKPIGRSLYTSAIKIIYYPHCFDAYEEDFAFCKLKLPHDKGFLYTNVNIYEKYNIDSSQNHIHTIYTYNDLFAAIEKSNEFIKNIHEQYD